ncbi:amidase [Niveibacterium sp. SC-1]|uniref:amidase n=1 Tax=Niveibacterium sp. SC-1 TaxID=3135646 RepID=UPI00311E6D03
MTAAASPRIDPWGALRSSASAAPSVREGPLAGLRFVVKDLIDIAGEVTGGGNPDWARTHGAATRSAPVVEALLAASARYAGKAHTDELAFSLEGENAHTGTPINPRYPALLPGGSSSGSAVAVAAGLADFALGTDTGGSVRVPASFCGIPGFRPSHGVLSLEGVLPFAPGYDSIGWFAATPALLRRVGDVLLPSSGDRTLGRLLLAEDVFALCEPDCAAALRVIAEAWKVEGTVRAFAADWQAAAECYRVLQGGEIRDELGPWIRAARPHFGENIAPRFADALAITDEEIAAQRPVRAHFAAHLHTLLGEDGVLVLPTCEGRPLRRDSDGAARGRFYPRALAINALAGHAGLPQITLPVVELEGEPLGLSLIGPRNSDRALLALAERVWRQHTGETAHRISDAPATPA